jgi:hypothetical protein
MRLAFLVLSIVVAAVVTSGCRSRSSPAPVTVVPPSPPPATVADVVQSLIWNIPSGLPIFGVAGSNSIRVVIFGMSVQHPGFYFLPRGATVSDAVDAAGSKQIVAWKHYSGIARLKPDGSPSKIDFPSRGEGLRIQLNEGDQIYFAHEVY